MYDVKKAVVFGVGSFYERYKDDILNSYNVVAYVDNDKKKIGSAVDGIMVSSPDDIKDMDYDTIIITSIYCDNIIHDYLVVSVNSWPNAQLLRLKLD